MTGNVAIGGIVGLLGVLPAIALIAGGAYLWASDERRRPRRRCRPDRWSASMLLVVSMLIIQAMRGVFGVALYRFAPAGEVTTGVHRGRPELSGRGAAGLRRARRGRSSS